MQYIVEDLKDGDESKASKDSRDEEDEEEDVPSYMRVGISGEETSGVSVTSCYILVVS